MARLLLLACLLLIPLTIACGGGGNDDEDAEQTEQDLAATATPDLLPTPPPAGDEDPILQAAAGETVFTPTMAQFRELPWVTIDADGEKEGVSLAELARQVSAPEDTVVTIQGTRRDGRHFQFVRGPLSEIGDQSVLVLEEGGQLSFYSTALGEDQWLINVVAVSFP